MKDEEKASLQRIAESVRGGKRGKREKGKTNNGFHFLLPTVDINRHPVSSFPIYPVSPFSSLTPSATSNGYWSSD
jgi:hypothetical protein